MLHFEIITSTPNDDSSSGHLYQKRKTKPKEPVSHKTISFTASQNRPVVLSQRTRLLVPQEAADIKIPGALVFKAALLKPPSWWADLAGDENVWTAAPKTGSDRRFQSHSEVGRGRSVELTSTPLFKNPSAGAARIMVMYLLLWDIWAPLLQSAACQFLSGSLEKEIPPWRNEEGS